MTVAGKELEIFRRSVPYGTAVEHGLYFVAFSAERARYDRMLARMFGVSGDGVRDRLTDFSRPVSGAYYFGRRSTRSTRWPVQTDSASLRLGGHGRGLRRSTASSASRTGPGSTSPR
ncbi:MAG: porphyrinogen peroxidase [Solirubrobacteraceae bacterium]|jgi:deferrochelatase/peroxidase EfeB|nr:porphyrinogen peroxidase [Solirubrobacteraceae bacterium]